MKKSKIMMISSLALAMVASLVMAFAMMNVTKAEPSKVSATGKVIYFYDPSDIMTDLRIHYWGGSGGSDNSSWPNNLSVMSFTDHWASFDIGDNTDILFYDIGGKNQSENFEGVASGNVYTWREDDDGNSSNNWKYVGNYANLTAVDKTVYFYNRAGWETVNIHTFNNGLGTGGTGAWPGATMTAVDGKPGLYSYTLTDYNVFVTFNNGDGEQSDDLEVDFANRYYDKVSKIWYSDYDHLMPLDYTDSKYYLIGEVNGSTIWYQSNKSIAIDGTPVGENVAEKYNVYLEKDDVVLGKQGDKYFHAQGSNTEGGALECDLSGNMVVNETGYYNVYFTNEAGVGHMWFTKVVQHVKSKISTDGKWLLLITGFQMLDGWGDVEIGYDITLTKSADVVDLSAYDNVKYSSVWINGSSGDTEITSATLYGGTAGDFDLICREIDIKDYAGYTVTVTAKIKYISPATIFDTSKTVSYTIPAA